MFRLGQMEFVEAKRSVDDMLVYMEFSKARIGVAELCQSIFKLNIVAICNTMELWRMKRGLKSELYIVSICNMMELWKIKHDLRSELHIFSKCNGTELWGMPHSFQ